MELGQKLEYDEDITSLSDFRVEHGTYYYLRLYLHQETLIYI